MRRVALDQAIDFEHPFAGRRELRTTAGSTPALFEDQRLDTIRVHRGYPQFGLLNGGRSKTCCRYDLHENPRCSIQGQDQYLRFSIEVHDTEVARLLNSLVQGNLAKIHFARITL
ncbi:hypothetical protein [Polaromonas jejuensis]|uniref:Uncharacterized protein n=1 Tax=Polaromonas jejuensis TaxID=457502 RepID=A0ABW0Q8A7_9BURK|nr:hypothetical protein [Polaromonas jejuensis]